MKQGIVYLKSTGEIVGTLVCDPQSFHQQPMDNDEALLEISGKDTFPDSDRFYVENGEIVPTQRQRPSPIHWLDSNTKDWVANPEELWAIVRYERDRLLAESDWTTSVQDAPLSKEQTEAWKAYRQQLRDITKQPDPEQIAWPKKPD